LRNTHRRILGRKLRHAFARALAIALSIMLTTDTAVFAAGFGGLGGAFGGSKPTATPAVPAAPDDHAQREQTASRLDALAEVAQRIANEAPRDHDDPGAVLAKTGKDPAAIVDWIRNNTREIAYVGMLRGSSGVLMDRAGNSLDRSMLLADLLRRGGNDVRLARAQLDAKTAAALRARIEASAPKAVTPAPLDRAALLKQIGNDPRLDRAMAEKTVDRMIAESQRFESTVKDLYAKVFPAVMQALGNDPARDQKLVADAEAALGDHFWVQRHIAGAWEDLDPDADVVHKLTPEAILTPEQVPDSLKHRVTLRLVLETWSAGKLSESKLLERTWTPSELMGKSITLSHALLPQTSMGQIADQPDAHTKYVDQLTGAWVIEPMLRVGNDTITDKLYTLRGEVLPASAATLSSLGVGGMMNTQALGGVLGAFGGKPPEATTPPDEATAPVRVTAEWIEFQIDSPGRPSEQHRREIFDLIGPAARLARTIPQPPPIDAGRKRARALALSAIVDAYIFAATPADEWITRQSAQALGNFARTAAQYRRAGTSVAQATKDSPPARLLLPLWTWGLARTGTGILPPTAPVQPNVSLLWQQADPQATTIKLVFDVVSNRLGGTAKFSDRLAQGVIDTVMEHAVLGSSADTTNTAALEAMDLAAGHQWVMLDKAGVQRLTTLALSDDAKARIRSDLDKGELVIVPREAIVTPAGKQIAWWRVDPNSGLTLGIGANGRGTEMAEESVIDNWVMGTVVCAVVAVSRKIATGKGDAIHFVACMVSAAMAAPHGINAVYGHATLDLVIGIFEMVHDMTHDGGE
jgi:hypothetical protein